MSVTTCPSVGAITAPVLDSKGKTITPLSIVEMANPHGHWSDFQGLVVEPDSRLEGDEYRVAVYFFAEVAMHNFFHRRNSGVIEDWDERFAKENKAGEGEFLLHDNMWQKSSRIVFFKPGELVVQTQWSLWTLARRHFPNTASFVRELNPVFPKDPHAWQCFIEGCPRPAEKVAMFNVWGTVFPLYVCECCAPVVNGYCGDDLPKMKEPLLLLDGTPAVA